MYTVTCTHIQGQPMSMKPFLFLIVILKETWVLKCLESILTLPSNEIWVLDIATPILRENIKLFLMFGG